MRQDGISKSHALPNVQVLSSKPLEIETQNYKRAYARFIDIRTGHFSEIFGTIDDKEKDKLLTNIKWWSRPAVPRDMILPVRGRLRAGRG